MTAAQEENFEQHKSEDLAEIAREAGWEAVVVPHLEMFERTGDPKDLVWVLYAKRESETIKVEWLGDTQNSAVYNYGDYYLYPHWRGKVIQLLQGKPDPKKFSSKDKGRISEKTVEELVKTRDVPWETDDAPAFDILLAVLGKDIRWVAYSPVFDGVAKERNEHCPKESNLGNPNFRVHTTQAGKRVLNFANSFGFHSCYVDSILEVS